jgi:hypothetical protein
MRVRADQVQRIDLRIWNRRGLMRGNQRFTWSWNRGGDPAGSIGVSVADGQGVTLSYTHSNGVERQTVSQLVGLCATPCAFGGERQWFRCPCCANRALVLYLRGVRFVCRGCSRVAYASQSEDAMDRAWRKQSKLEARLRPNWQRPKGMRRRTYDKLYTAVLACEEVREAALEAFAARLVGLRL